MNKLTLRYATIETVEGGCVTRFHSDGAQVAAFPHPAMAHYSVISHRLGYADDLMRFCIEHEIMHSFVSERMFDAESPVLASLARGVDAVPRNAVIEEIVVQAVQGFVNANIRPIVSDYDWDSMREEAITHLREFWRWPSW